ncbi:GTP cyclohydrolase I [Vibrio phage 2.275.O._10N.286.54.E11]|nr:GTP cyclohydrolase I [Vibrio phage 2.275.O._10N.286.54.E11]
MCDNHKSQDVQLMENILNALDGINLSAAVQDVSSLTPGNLEDERLFMEKMISILDNESKKATHERIRERILEADAKFHANSNIAEFINDGEIDELIDECTVAFEKVLDCLIIDRENDPNSMDTPRRLAKMYILETMSGRFTPAPKVTAFPNTHTNRSAGFSGLLVVKTEIISMCSHHHQPVKGTVYTGIIPGETVLGLSKYSRIAQHLAKRGTLQEELAEDIAQKVMEETDSPSVAVYIEATHGCVTHRGVMAHDSTTQTTVVHGEFMSDGTLRKEFHDNIMYQKLNK